MTENNKECDHIIAMSDGIDESWLTYESRRVQEEDYMAIIFKYCPMCGKKLKEN